MKNHLAVVCCLSLSVMVQAQAFFHLAQPEFNNKTSAVAVAADGCVFLTGEQSDSGQVYETAVVRKLDGSGNLLWAQNIDVYYRSTIHKILPMPDGGAVVVGATWQCDHGGGGIVGRLSADGVWMWRHVDALSYSSGTPLEAVTGVQLASDGSLRAYGASRIYVFAASTGFLTTVKMLPSLGLGPYRGFYFDEVDERYFLNHIQGVFYWNPDTGDLTTIVSTQGSASYIDWLPLDSNLLLTYTSTGKMLLVDRQSLQTTLAYTPAGWLNAAWHSQQGLLAVLRATGISWYDTSGTEIHPTLMPPWDGIVPKALAWQNDTLVVAGRERHTQSSPQTNHSFWARGYVPGNAVLPEPQDAALVEVVMNVPPAFGGYDGSDALLYGGAFSVRVKNEGSAVMQRVRIQAGHYGYDPSHAWECGFPSIKTLEVENMQVLPGQDTLIAFGGLDSTLVAPEAGGQWQFCAWTSMPNNRVDANHGNNQTCVWLPLTVAAEEPQTGAFSLFPNPAADACTITWGENLRPDRVRVYDGVGRLLLNETVDSSAGRVDLQLGTLQSGVYWVVLGTVVQRLIKR